jgi:hypothetical protein
VFPFGDMSNSLISISRVGLWWFCNSSDEVVVITLRGRTESSLRLGVSDSKRLRYLHLRSVRFNAAIEEEPRLQRAKLYVLDPYVRILNSDRPLAGLLHQQTDWRGGV